MIPVTRIIYALAFIIGLTIGGFFGFRWSADLLKINYDARRLTVPRELGDFSFMQYRYADVEHARTALLTYADLLQKLEVLDPNRGEKLELANTYTRLALLEDSANNGQASQNYMANARYWYTVGGGQDHPDSEMKAGVNALDERFQQLNIR